MLSGVLLPRFSDYASASEVSVLDGFDRPLSGPRNLWCTAPGPLYHRRMTGFSTIPELITRGSDAVPAIAAPQTVPLTYQGLRALAASTTAELNRCGIGRNDRVAIVLPNGPEMAAAFVAIGAAATTAPLNPAYKESEFEFYLNDLKAKALIVEAGARTPAREVASRLGVPIVELVAQRSAGVGSFVLVPLAARTGFRAGNLAAVMGTVKDIDSLRNAAAITAVARPGSRRWRRCSTGAGGKRRSARASGFASV